MATVKDSLNTANPQNLADNLRSVALGDMMRAETTHLRAQAPAVNSSNLSSLKAVALPDDAKASYILRAYARAGSAGTGEMSVQSFGTTPTSGQIAVAPNGDIVTLGSDAITNLDVVYVPEKVDIVTLTGTVTSNAFAIPSSYTVVSLHSATANTGTVTGAEVILTPSGSAATTGTCRLDVAKANVKFYSGDAVTNCTVTLGVVKAVDSNAVLESAANL